MSRNYTSTKLACYLGFIVQAIINNFLPILFIALQNVYALSYEMLARLIVFNFATQMATDLVTPKIVGKLSYKMAASLSQLTAALGLLLLGILPSIMSNTYIAIIISIIVYAFGSGLMEVILSPMMEMLPSKNKSGSMSFLHSFYCWGQAFTIIITTVLVAAFGYKGWMYIPLIWAIIPFINSICFLRVPVIEPEVSVRTSRFKELFKSRKFRLYMVMMLCAGASEIAMAEWSSMFAQQALGVSKVIGDLAGPCAFAIFMGVGRVLYASFSNKILFKKLLVIMSLLCFACYIIVAISKIPMLSLAFCALCGFTVSISWPGLYSAGIGDFPLGGSIMFSVFALCGDTGCSLGPWVLGIVADKFNLNIGFGVASIFPIIMVVTALVSMKKDCKN